jgi:broad specificity phosphatase PhoE
MSRLVLVRHGQASFGAADYDQLSALGEEQSACLGQFFAGRQTQIDAIYCGPSKRHVQTAAGIQRGSKAAGMPLPQPTVVPDLREFPALELFQMHRDAALHEERGSDESGSASSFEAICESWMCGRLDSGQFETALHFEARVTSSLLEICAAQGRGKNVLVVTSGGPTMITMKMVLGLEASKACALLWSARRHGPVLLEHGLVSEVLGRSALGPLRLRLPGPRRRQHGDPAQVRHRAAEASAGSSRWSPARSAAASR